MAPTLLANAPAQAKVSCEEVFGPVMTIAPVAGVDAALAAVNDSQVRFAGGLVHPGPAGGFPGPPGTTGRWGGHRRRAVLPRRSDAVRRVKSSGLGREGLRAAMTDLTHDRVMVLTGLDL